MQRYEKYKDSKVGEIPEHWDFKRFRYCLNLNKGLTITKVNLKDDGIPCVNYGEIHSKFGFEIVPEKDTLKCVDEDYLKSSEQSLLNRGDFVFADTSEDIKGSGNFTHLHSDTKIFAGYHTIIARLKIDADYRYIAYYFDSLSHRHQIRQQVKGVKVYSITNLILKDTFIFLPPKEEQEKIATYLTKKTKEIDILISQKEQLLSLYEEEKKAIINQAVTKGIDSYIKLKYLISKIGSGVTPRGGANVYKLQGIPLLRSQNIHFDGLHLDNVVYITEETHENMQNSQVYQGDVLLNITGASIGRCYYVSKELIEANVNQHVCIIRPTEKILTEFLYFVLRSNLGQEQIDREQTGSGREGLNLEALKNFLIPSIDVDRQKIIIDSIKNEFSIINKKIQKTKNIIALQKEYRTALISEVVTGKVKVTEEV